jgi:hypothetical protein
MGPPRVDSHRLPEMRDVLEMAIGLEGLPLAQGSSAP